MERKAVFALIACWFIFCFAKVNPTVKEKINWLSIDELNLKLKTETKPVLIDLFTNWCYWCKVMDKKTYNDSKVISYINNHFYAVKLNAETKETVEWNNKDYKYNSESKLNDFTFYVTQGQVGFPTTVIFPEAKQPPASIPGFMEPKDIESILKYFGEGYYKTQKFEEFSANFKPTW
ncbi:MAG: DUF255 domain-containing protein [Bacteroidota bacterium]|nr:DUF255 domain-containing protein [Bacteroidota bacterium]